MSDKNFYCQQLCGFQNFSIEEWNDYNKRCNALGITPEPHRTHIICKEQCFDCIAIVGETRLKNATPKS